MRIECTQGCGALLDVHTPTNTEIAAARTLIEAESEGRPTPPETETTRAIFEQRIGQAVTEALIVHAVIACPVALAADADCGARSPMGYTCNLQARHGGDVHEYHAVHPGEPPEADDHLIASWPNLQAGR